MIRAIRPNAMAQDDAALIAGWNVAPNVEYTLLLLPSSVSCGVFLYADSTLVASGAALAGTEQPCILIPQTGQVVGMVDADLGWHLLLTTTGTESQRTIRIGPAADLPDEIHPIYGEDDLALVRATAAINAAAHYIDDVTVTCPLGLGAGLGDVVSVPVDDLDVVGQVESITWSASPDGAIEQAVIRRHVAIAPDAFVEIVPPTVADDTGEATQNSGTSGNVLTNDESGLTVTAVNGLSANVGQAVDGDNGGSFTINANGTWTFSPAGDFALLEGSETADTSVTYHASDGTSESMGTLTVTVSVANAAPVATNDTGETDAETPTSGNVLTNDTDTDEDELHVSKVAGSTANVSEPVAGSNGGLFTIEADGAWSFDPDGDFSALTGEQTATTGVTYHVSDGVAEDEGTLTVTVSAVAVVTWTPSEITTLLWLDASDTSTATVVDGKVSQRADKSGNGFLAAQITLENRPTSGTNKDDFDGINDRLVIPHNSALAAPAYMAIVAKANVTGQYKGLIDKRGNSAGWMVEYGPTATQGQPRLTATSTVLVAPTSVHNVLAIVEAQMAGESSFVGTPAGVTTGTLPAPSGVTSGVTIAGNGTQTNPTDLDFHEAVILPSAPDATLRQTIQGYLAHKWDDILGVTTLVDALPVDHPYKSAAPTL